MIKRSKVKDLLKANPGQEVLAKGWVRTKRGNKQIKFIALNDGSTVNNIQVVADMTNFDEALIAKITTGASISVTGNLIESVGSGHGEERGRRNRVRATWQTVGHHEQHLDAAPRAHEAANASEWMLNE